MTTLTKESPAVEFFQSKLEFQTTPFTLKHNMEKGKAYLLDVRDKAAYDAEHIPGAVNTPLADLEKSLGQLPKDKTLVTYCWHFACALAPKAALFLAQNGFKVQELNGGIEMWKRSFPTDGSAAKK
jgi:rhodanese-related sulfurtransferase